MENFNTIIPKLQFVIHCIRNFKTIKNDSVVSNIIFKKVKVIWKRFYFLFI